MNAEERLIPIIESVIGVGRVWSGIVSQTQTVGELHALITDVAGTPSDSPCIEDPDIDRLFQVDLYGANRKELRDKSGLICMQFRARDDMQIDANYESEPDPDTKEYRRIVQVRVNDALT